MRLLAITNDFPPVLGGIEHYAYSLVRRWNPAEVAVLTRLVPGAAAFDRRLDFEVHRHPVRTLLPGRDLLRTARRIVEEHSIEVVHFFAPLPLPLLGPRLRSSHGIPYAVSVHGGEFVLPASLPVARALLRRGLRSAAVLLCESTFVRERVRRFFRDGPPTVYVPAGVDPDRFSRKEAPVFAPPEGGPVILSVSRLVARKGPATLVRSLPHVLKRHPHAHLVVVGGGPDRRRLERLASTLGVRAAVTFAGPQEWSEVPRFYAAAAIFALPTRERFGGLETEGLPLVYLEAAAAGLPSVAGRAGGVSDAVIDGETGYLVDGRSPEDTAEALLRLLDDPERAREMGERARRRVLEQFTWDEVFERFRHALEHHAGG